MKLKFFYRKSWNPSFLQKNFENPNFRKHRRVHARCISTLWDEKIPTEERFSPPRILNFCSIPEIFWSTKRFHHKFFGTVRQKNSTKSWCPFYSKDCLKSEQFWNTEVFSHDVFRRCETKNSRWKNEICPHLIQKNFPCQKFSEAQKVPTPISLVL